MTTFYDEWLQVGDQIQQQFMRSPKVARDREIPWVQTRQDARVKLMVSESLGFATMGIDVLRAEIPVGAHTGRHRHGEEGIHILRGSGFIVVNGRRFDFRKGTTFQIPYRAEHQLFNTGDEVVQYISGMAFTLERWMKLARMEQLEDRGENDPAVLASFPAEQGQYYPDGARAAIHIEDAPDDPEFEPQKHLAAGQNQHHYVKYLSVPGNGFRGQSVSITHLWEEPAGHHSGRHKHLEAVVYAYDGEGYTELEGQEEKWERGDVLHVPPSMWEHEHYNTTPQSYWQLRIQSGIRFWWTDVWPEGYTNQRIYDEFGKPIIAGKIERIRERE